MSFVRNYSDNQSPGDSDSPNNSQGPASTNHSNPALSGDTAASFIRNYSDNQSPGDSDAPNATQGQANHTSAGAEAAAQRFDRKVEEGLQKSYEATHNVVNKMMGNTEARKADTTNYREAFNDWAPT